MLEIEQKDLGQLVYDQLKSLIVGKELKPGEQIRQEAMSKRLGVSRTPLLKALQMLEHEFLVEFIARRGVFVKEYSLQEMIEIYELREVVEGLATRRAAEHMTDSLISELKEIFAPFDLDSPIDRAAYEEADRQFHLRLLEIGSGSVLKRYKVVENMSILAYQMGLHVPPVQTLEDHRRIIDALEARDGVEAENLMRQHIALGRRELARRLESQKEKMLSPKHMVG